VSTETELLIKGSNLLPPALDDQAADRFLFDPERRLAALAPQMLQAEEGALKVFPNPARDHVQILLPSAIQENRRISVYNAAGQLVRSLELEGPGSTSAALDLTGLERGVYFIRLQSPGYSGVTRLVVGQ
ncbi:MAG: T9SS type A sorting domain-containing protein, partial [Lewinella sp.]|nr:T9SS type A sorting domain-containing protein [Lewinella sp.]